MIVDDTKSLYSESYESDACGIGCVANIDGLKTNQIITDSLTILENMSHRGASGNNKKIGDGAGLKTQIPHNLLLKELSEKNVELPSQGKYGLGMIFFPNNLKEYNTSTKRLQETLKKFKLTVLAKRNVPVNSKDLCKSTLNFIPKIEQWVIKSNSYIDSEDKLNRILFIARRYFENITLKDNKSMFSNSVYIASLSTNTVVYKGQLTTHQIRTFYPDLSDKLFESSFSIVHSRFSTNTFPSWKLAQPFRFISHNGEINTLQGNLNSLKSAEARFQSTLFSKEELNILRPVTSDDQSDSACLDNLIELLSFSGTDINEIMMMLIPESWDNNDNMPNQTDHLR